MIDCQGEHCLFATVVEFGIWSLVRERDAAAHFSDIPDRAGRAGLRSRDGQSQQNGVCTRLVMQDCQRQCRASVFEQKIGISQRCVGIRRKPECAAVGAIGGGAAPCPLFQFGNTGGQPRLGLGCSGATDE